jgi:hypothetical protein
VRFVLNVLLESSYACDASLEYPLGHIDGSR